MMRLVCMFFVLGCGLASASLSRDAFSRASDAVLWRWSARGEQTKLTDPATNIVSRVYDPVGNQVYLTNRNGKLWQFSFDGANRLVTNTTPLNRKTITTYNSRGLVETVKEPSGDTTTLLYDPRNRLTNRADNVGTTVYLYDANNNLTNVLEGGRSNSWTFDAYDRVSSYRDADGN